MSIFASELISYRKKLQKTQLEFVNFLSSCDIGCQGIDVVTLSRWETGKTCPTIRKRLRILLALNLHRALREEIEFQGYKPNELKTVLIERYTRVIGGCDYFYSNSAHFNCLEYSNLDAIPDYFINSYDDNVATDLQNSLIRHKYKTHTVLYENEFNIPIGHLVYIDMSTAAFKETNLYRTSTFFDFELPKKQNEHVLVIPTSYAIKAKIFGEQLKKLAFILSSNSKYVSKIIYVNRLIGSHSLLEALGGKAVAFGPRTSTMKGVLYNKVNYDWVVYSFSPDEFLFSSISAQNIINHMS